MGLCVYTYHSYSLFSKQKSVSFEAINHFLTTNDNSLSQPGAKTGLVQVVPGHDQ